MVQQVCDFFRRHIGNRGAKKSFPFPNFLSLRRGPQIGNNRYVLLLYITKELFLYFFISFLFFFMIFFCKSDFAVGRRCFKKKSSYFRCYQIDDLFSSLHHSSVGSFRHFSRFFDVSRSYDER